MRGNNWLAPAVVGLLAGAFLGNFSPPPVVGKDVPQGRTLYVSPAGSNTNPGTAERPWATPGYASRQLRPGDTLIIQKGRYVLSQFDDDVLTPPSGTRDAWITIRGESDQWPVLVGRDNLLTAVNLSGVAYFRLENLEITHDDKAKGNTRHFRDAIQLLEKPGKHIVLKDLYVHHIDEFGINVQDVEHLEVVNCRLEYCGFGAIGGPAGTRGGWREASIRGCALSYSGHYYQGTDGAKRPYDRPDGLGLEVSAGPVEVTDTVAEHNRGDGLDSKAERTSIRNCVVANNSCDGIKLWGDGSRAETSLVYGTGDGVGGESPWAGVVIQSEKAKGAVFELINVTVHDNPKRRAYPMYVQYGHKTPLQLTMRNCIVANGSGPVHFGGAMKLVAEHNLFFRPGEEVQVEWGEKEYTAGDLTRGRLGKGNLSADPQFVQPAWGKRGDYHLRDGSPGIDAGAAQAPAKDLDGKKRPAGKGVDLGCYER